MRVAPGADDVSPPEEFPVADDTSDASIPFEDAAFAIDGGFGCGPQAPVPDFGTPVTCGAPPPPISGGTLLVTRDGSMAIASDPDRNEVFVVDLASKARRFTIALQAGDEPGRLAEDGAGRIHVALRGSGMLATIDPALGTVTTRRAVCPAPRGVAWQASTDTVWVACATGELASLPAAGGAASIRVIERDLRDVIVSGDDITVTLFRSAQLLRLAADGSIARTDTMPSAANLMKPHVAWRAVSGPGGTVVAVHQEESTQSVSTKSSGGYGCGGGGLLPLPIGPGVFDAGVSLLGASDASSGFSNGSDPDAAGEFSDASDPDAASEFSDAGPSNVGSPPILFPPGLFGAPLASAVTVMDGNGGTTSTATFNGVLPVDVAVSPDGATIVAIAAGSGAGAASVDNLFTFATASANNVQSERSVPGQATAVAFDPSGNLIVQTREPAALWLVPESSQGVAAVPDASVVAIPLSVVSKRDTGHDIFHTHAGALIACASCHPEGGDDGHVWLLDDQLRRTPSLRGTIAGTAPYHWPGDEADFTSIVKDVYEVRMSGGTLTKTQTGALSAWVNAIPAPPPPTWVDANAAAAGRALFERADVGCATCHSGAKFTNNATVDVGTGGAFQVPPLVGVGWRTPLMHAGCASTIADRFGSCSTPQHGNIAMLSTTDITNLSAYLETL
jgi:YD repeat-containing protein